MLSTIVGANHFCRMWCVCVISVPKIYKKVPSVYFSFNMGMCFLQCVFSIQMQYNIQSAIYTSRNCLHILIRPWFRDCCSLIPFFFFFFVYLCQCHEYSCCLLMSPPSPLLSPFSSLYFVCWVIGKSVLWCTRFEKVGFKKRKKEKEKKNCR